MRVPAAVLVVLRSMVLALALGCGGSSGGPSTSGNGSCTLTSNGMIVACTDYGSPFTMSQVMQVCGTAETYSPDTCPSANRVGRCEITDVNAGDAVSAYAPETAAQAMSACAMENGVMGVMTKWVPQ